MGDFFFFLQILSEYILIFHYQGQYDRAIAQKGVGIIMKPCTNITAKIHHQNVHIVINILLYNLLKRVISTISITILLQ